MESVTSLLTHPTSLDGKCYNNILYYIIYVTAARVLPGILGIRETLPEILVDDSGDDAFVVYGIGTSIRFWWPIPMGSQRG